MAAAARVAGRGRRGPAPAPRPRRRGARAGTPTTRDPGGLYRGARLAAALDWAAGHAAELSPAERAFLDASRSASGRAQRRLRMMLAGVAALLVLAVIAGLVALDQRGDARAEATTAAAQRLGAQALSDASLDRGMLLARQGVALDDSRADPRQPARHAAQEPRRDRRDRRRRRPAGEPRPQPATGARWRSSTTTGRWRRVDPATRRRQAPRRGIPGFLGGPFGVDVVRFSDDGSLLAVAGPQPVVSTPRPVAPSTSLPTSELAVRRQRGVLGGPAIADRHDRQPVRRAR